MMPSVKDLDRKLTVTVFLVGFVCLMVELIQIRMFSFFLGNVINFIAIPIALLGLALGSLYYHYFYRGDGRRLIALCSVAVFPLVVVVFVLFFAVSNAFYADIHISIQTPARDLDKLLIYSALFLLPYMVFGTLLAVIFSIGANRIGRLYFYDLAGAALGCVATPVLFTYADLPAVIMALLGVALVLSCFGWEKHRTAVAIGMVAVFCAMGVLAAKGMVLKDRPNPAKLARAKNYHVTEVAVRWNELTRTSLIRLSKPGSAMRPDFVLVQNGGLGHVSYLPYDPQRTKAQALGIRHAHAAAYRAVGYEPKKILVMFAGSGRDMIMFDGITQGKAQITGVELNGTIEDFSYHPALADFKLKQFYQKRNIRFVIKEGRDFLNNDKTIYDLIFISRSGSIFAHRIGNTGRYLETYEAKSAYLDHLAPGGVIYVWNQPGDKSARIYRKLFEEKGLGDVRKALYALTYYKPDSSVHNLIIKPSGLTPEDIETIERHLPKDAHTLYSPTGSGYQPFIDLLNAPIAEIEADMMTDDRPFFHKIDLESFELFPGKKKLSSLYYSAQWIKVFTVIVFAVICLLVILVVAFAGGKGRRLPIGWILYFLVSGISYMCVEIALINKTELFMGNPLYAVAVILAVFLGSNSLGAFLQDRYSVMRGPKTLILITAAAVAWGLGASELCSLFLLSLPIFLKVICVVLCVLPAGTSLGMYYPFGVTNLVGGGLKTTVPVSYTIATLSSVFGSAYAMTAVMNLGFTNVILIGVIGYSLVGLIYAGIKKLTIR